MDKTNYRVKVFAVEDNGEGLVTSLGEFKTLDELKIRPADFANDILIEFEEYWIGGEE